MRVQGRGLLQHLGYLGAADADPAGKTKGCARPCLNPDSFLHRVLSQVTSGATSSLFYYKSMWKKKEHVGLGRELCAFLRAQHFVGSFWHVFPLVYHWCVMKAVSTATE